MTELGRARAATVDAATAVPATFLPRFNARFAVPAAAPGSAFRPFDDTIDLLGICAVKYERRVGLDNMVTVEGQHLQLLP